MANTYVTETLSGARFSDGSTLSGTYTAEYNASGALIQIINPNLTVTPTSGAATSFTNANVATATGSFELTATKTGATYSNLSVDWSGQTPTTLNATSGSAATTATNAAGASLSLSSTGTVAGAADQLITTTINGAAFADGATLSGSWTGVYSSTGFLEAVDSSTFTVTGPGGTNTFTNMGTLPYADDPTASGFTSYEVHSQTTTGTGTYNSLYLDWKTETPSSFYEGSPSLYTSVKNSAVSATASIRLVSDGNSGTGSVPTITGLPAAESGTDNAVVIPFSGVTVTDSDHTTTTSATITLSVNGLATDADGVLSGTGLTKISTGTYGLASTSPANLTTELDALKFTPTAGQVAVGSTVPTKIDLAINDSDGSAAASSNLTVTAACFLRGTMIATPRGETAVENLTTGDLVTVIENGIRFARPVTWVGGGSMDAAGFGNRADAFPVRIRKDAFADGSPARDLLVTPEHCILTEAGLTPVRMLVNRRSIVIDRSIPRYDFHHVELEAHGILLSEGLATESYLDTGNRDLFVDQADGIQGRDGLTLAAPLAVARITVEPLWNRLADRARDLGLEDGQPVAAVTDQPELRLLLDTGVELAAWWHDEQRHMFHIPRHARPVRLLSRSSVPSEMIGPFVDDRRRLGVAVDRLVLWNGLNDTIVPLAQLARDGWHETEGAFRWTDGDAAIDLPQAGAETFLDIHLAGTAVYVMNLAAA